MTARLGVFAKYWQPGEVKTRLAQALGAQAASQVYRQCLACLLTRLSDYAAQRELWFAPDSRQPEFEQLAAGRFACRPQGTGDLGQRMARFFAASAGPTVLVGSDSPQLPRAALDRAFAVLVTCDAVLGPADDGGYDIVKALDENRRWSGERPLIPDEPAQP